MDAVLNWQQAYEAGPKICGGKGYNLARLSRYGFRIPRGGVLPVGASISQIDLGLERLGLVDAEVAVRSSATGEDSARASFAGIHQSFLQVSGAAAVRQKAQECIASLQTPEAVAYRRRMGFADGEVQCAVVICEMVKARFAGVAFSGDPSTGRRNRIVIEAVRRIRRCIGERQGERDSHHLGALRRQADAGVWFSIYSDAGRCRRRACASSPSHPVGARRRTGSTGH